MQSNSISNVGASIQGFNAPSGSNLAGYDGAHINGGSPDPNASSVNGGVGLVATGGSLSGTTLCCYEGNGGTGIVANGGGSGYDGAGGTGLIANGAGGGANGQGAGVIGTGAGGGLTAGAQGISGYGGSGGTCDLCGGGGAGGSFDGGPGNCLVTGEPNCDGDGVDATTADGGVYSTAGGYAGNFTGDINVTGTIYGTINDAKIDHPLDPANKYLLHASVESSEMMNLYTGNVTTDSEGRATVKLPEWFEAVNTDFRYQLTVIGQFAQAIVAREIQNHEFVIRTSVPNVKVSWQITGVRHDAYAKANPLVVEQAKEAKLRGYYIHPELYGAPSTKQIEWARNPEMMKQLAKHTQEIRAKHLSAVSAAAQPQAGAVSGPVSQ